MALDYAIVNKCWVGTTRAGYHSGKLLCQIGKRLVPARVGRARAGASLIGLLTTVSNLRHIRKNTLRIYDLGRSEVPTCEFSIQSRLATRPQDGQMVVIAVGTLLNRLFAGHISNPSETHLSGPWFQYGCSAQGFAKALLRRLVNRVYREMYAGKIVEDLLEHYAPNFYGAGNMEKGVFIEEISFDFVSVLDACNTLANRSGYVFYVTPLREIRFMPQDKHSAPWDVSDQERYSGLRINEDSSELKNRIIVRYSKLIEMTEDFRGDGETKQFYLLEEPHEITGITVNGTPVTYGTRYAEDNSEHDFSIRHSEKYISTMKHPVLTANEVLSVSYWGKTPARLVINDTRSQAERAAREGGDGIHEFLINDREIFSLADARQRAEDELARYSNVRISATYNRKESVFDFFRNRLLVGMSQCLTARGRDEMLTISKVTITVCQHEGNSNLAFMQDVSLGETPSLTDVFREVTQSNQEQQDIAEIETVMNL